MIHPFRDGNGRMCRLLANAFLMKYAGIVISVGEHDEDRASYMAIAKLAGEMGLEGQPELGEPKMQKKKLVASWRRSSLARLMQLCGS